MKGIEMQNNVGLNNNRPVKMFLLNQQQNIVWKKN